MPTNMFSTTLVRLLPIALFGLLGACAAPPQFVEVIEEEEVAGPVPRHSLAELPFPDHWSKLTLNGGDAGFTHINVLAGDTPDEFILRSEAYLQLFLFGTKTTIIITSTDWVAPNLQLKRFKYDYLVDGVKTSVEGTVTEQVLRASMTDDNGTSEQVLPLQRPLYPSRAASLYPVLNGLEKGKSYSYLTYDGETHEVKTVLQRVEAYGRSDKIEGRAYKVMSNVSGSTSSIWIDEQGRALLEVSMKGIFLANRLDPAQAREALVGAAFNQQPFYSDYTTVLSDQVIQGASKVSALRIDISGFGDEWVLPSGDAQRCWREASIHSCQIVSNPKTRATVPFESVEIEAMFPSVSITSEDEVVQETARDIVKDVGEDVLTQIDSLTRWIASRVRRGTDPAQSGAQMLGGNRKSGPLGRTYLYASLARALGIPTRIANGLVYSEEDQGFIYHGWAESWVDGLWYRVDPAFGGLSVDATHIKLMHGDTLAEIQALSDVIGRVSVRVLAYDD